MFGPTLIPPLFADASFLDVSGLFSWLLLAWFLVLGAGIGSFMNVVVYRVPAGKSVVHPGSRCPKCGMAIRSYDNIPVLSWLLLRGRCRKCQTPISTRYPLVEALVASVFFFIAARQLLTGGANLPHVDASPRWVPISLFAVYACQMLALCTLICAALIEYDGQRMPKRLLMYAIVVVGLASPWLEALPPLPISGLFHWSSGLTGAAVGAILGMAVRLRWRAMKPSGMEGVPRRGSTPELELMLIGFIIGWQMVALLACVAVIAELCGAVVHRLFRAPRLPWNAWLAFGLFLIIAGFAQIAAWLPPAWLVDPIWIVGVTGFVGVVSCLASRLDRLGVIEPKGESPVRVSPEENLEAISSSPSYRIAAYDTEFLQREELRPVRLQLELLKPEMAFLENDIRSTIVAFGGTQIVERGEAQRRLEETRARLEEAPEDPYRRRAVERAERVLANSPYYDAAREFGRLVSSLCQADDHRDYVIVTGGGPGIMEAANRGAFDAGAKSIGLNITLPAEQVPNAYITPELCFQFHYFALRKMHFLMRAKALVVFPGGFGTLDELFDALTLRQTQRMQEIPIILFGRAYWERVLDFQFLADEGVIADAHLDLIDYAETAEEAWDIIRQFHDRRAAQ